MYGGGGVVAEMFRDLHKRTRFAGGGDSSSINVRRSIKFPQ